MVKQKLNEMENLIDSLEDLFRDLPCKPLNSVLIDVDEDGPQVIDLDNKKEVVLK